MLALIQTMIPKRFPVEITEAGVTATIRKFSQTKNGKTYSAFITDYILLGKRKRVWRSDFEDAKQVALNACRQIANGHHTSLTLTDTDRLSYLRATEALSSARVKLDVAAHEYANALTLLGGRATITEACREWIKHHVNELAPCAVAKAVNEAMQQATADGKSVLRIKQLGNVLYRFSEGFNVNLQDISPSLVSQYLARLPLAERSRRNHRDVIGFFNRFCILRGYLKKGTDWLEGVQNYSARKIGTIEIYTPEEMKVLFSRADRNLVPFLAIERTHETGPERELV